MKHLDQIQLWYDSLQQREQVMVLTTSVIVVITLFYLIIWEPIHNNMDNQQQINETQINNYLWMQDASREILTLRASGKTGTARNANQPVSLLVEKSARTAGIKSYINKIETTSDKKVRVKLDEAPFDQILLWLNTLEQNYNISAITANIEQTEKPGTVRARLTLNRH